MPYQVIPVTLSDSDGGYLLEEMARVMGLPPEAVLRVCLENRAPLVIRRHGVFLTPEAAEWLVGYANRTGPFREAVLDALRGTESPGQPDGD